jgi:hypothetical protein
MAIWTDVETEGASRAPPDALAGAAVRLAAGRLGLFALVLLAILATI